MKFQATRRSVLRTAGLGGVGLAGVGLARGVARAYETGALPPAALRALPRVPESVRATDRAALGREENLKLPAGPAAGYRFVELYLAPEQEYRHTGIDAVRQAAAEFLCDPRRPNLLVEGVKRVAYEISEVAWQPGTGWPIYRTRAPLTDAPVGQRYPGVPRHQIVFLDDRAVYVGNAGACGVIEGIQGPLRIDINGDSHGEHRGYYRILLTAVG